MKTKRLTLATAIIFLLTLLAAIIIPINTPAKATPPPSSEPKTLRTCKGKIYQINQEGKLKFEKDENHPTISITTHLLLNDAEIVGGTTPEKYEPKESWYHDLKLTISYSPDRNYALVQGDKMYLKYVGKEAIENLNRKGKNNELPGKVTLRWKKAAIEYDTGEELDVELTIDNLNLTASIPYGVLSDMINRPEEGNNEITVLRNIIEDKGKNIQMDYALPTLNPQRKSGRENIERKIGTSDTHGYKEIAYLEDKYGYAQREYREAREALEKHKGVSTLFSKTELNIERNLNSNSLHMDDYECRGTNYSPTYRYKDGDGIKQIYKNCSIPLSSHSNQTFRFIKQDGEESNGEILTWYFSELDEAPGYKWEKYRDHWVLRKPNYEMQDKGQPHIKTLDERDFVYPNPMFERFDYGGMNFVTELKQYAEERSFKFNADWEKIDYKKFKEAIYSMGVRNLWEVDWPNNKTTKPTEFWVTGKPETALANLCTGSGSKIEVGNNGYLPVLWQPKGYYGDFIVDSDKAKLDISKLAKINGFTQQSGGQAPNGYKAQFLYRVTNIGESSIYNIKVDDDKRVKVECPKKNLIPSESMICQGDGKIFNSQK